MKERAAQNEAVNADQTAQDQDSVTTVKHQKRDSGPVDPVFQASFHSMQPKKIKKKNRDTKEHSKRK